MSQREGSTVLCKLELHALSKKTVLKISLNPGLNLTIILGTGPRVISLREIILFFTNLNGYHFSEQIEKDNDKYMYSFNTK